jgi:hypothetical protein
VLPDLTFRDNDAKTAVGFALPFIFDKFVYLTVNRTTPEPLSKMYAKLSSFCKEAPLQEWVEAFVASEQGTVAKELYLAAITDKSMFSYVGDEATPRNPSGPESRERDQMLLHTRMMSLKRPFQGGSSLSHVDQFEYINKTEFLMRPFSSSGRTLKDLKAQAGAVLGPRTLKLLAKMGYRVVGVATRVSSGTQKQEIKCAQSSPAPIPIIFGTLHVSISCPIVLFLYSL